MTQPLRITAHTLREVAQCHRLAWLNRYGDLMLRDEINARNRHAQNYGLDYERRTLQLADPNAVIVPVADWNEGVTLTRQWLAQGASVIQQACLEVDMTIDGHSVRLRGKVDRLAKGHGTPFYNPIEIKSATRLTALDRLQLDMYIYLLTLVQGREPLRPQFWINNNGEVDAIDHDYDPEALHAVLAQVVHILADVQQTPPVVLLPHCSNCRWLSQCKQHESAREDIGQLLLKARTAEQLRLMGVHTLSQLAALPLAEIQQVYGIKTTAPALQAQAQAFLQGRPMRFAPLADCVGEPCVMFDIETNPTTKTAVWSLGVGTAMDAVDVIIVAPRRPAQTLLTADNQRIHLVPDSDALWRTFMAYSADLPHAFHWSNFDQQVLRRTAPRDVVAGMAHRTDDLLAHTRRSTAFPLNSLSLKVVGPYCGYQWTSYDAWDAAWLDYNKWLREDDEDALIRACNYQRDDVKAMFAVRDVLLSW